FRHGVEERHQDARAARADRMPEGDGATVDVDARLRDTQLPQHAERLRGERLVQLPEVDLFAPEASAGQRLLGSRPWPHAHDRRIDTGRRPGPDGRQRLEPAVLRLAIRHHYQRRRAVVDARRVAGRDRTPIGLERGTQWLQLVDARGARVLVDLELEGLALL